MEKRAALINLLNKLKSEFPRHFEHIDINCVEIYIDVQDRKERSEIFKILVEYRSTVAIIARVILENRIDKDYYGKEPYGTMAMKFKNKKTNPRIYCLDFKGEGQKRRIVMVMGVWNKTEVNKTIKDKLNAIKDYQYEFFKNPRDAIKHRKKK
jgi:hypothetical protein